MKKALAALTLCLSFASFGFSAETWVAKVNGKVISKQKFDTILKKQAQTMQIISGRKIESSGRFKNKQFLKNILLSYIGEQLLMSRVKRENKRKHFVSEYKLNSIIKNVKANLENKIYLNNYVQKVLLPKTKDIPDALLEKNYQKAKKIFDSRNIGKKRAYAYIKQRYKQAQIRKLMIPLQKRVRRENSIVANPQFFRGKRTHWIAKINGKTLTTAKLKNIYEINLQIAQSLSGGRIDPKLKYDSKRIRGFANMYIMNSLVIKELKKFNRKNPFVSASKIKKTVDIMSEKVKDQFFMQSYVEKVLFKKVRKINSRDIEMFYNKNRKRFRGMPASKAASIIRQELKERGAGMLLKKLLNKLKEESRIILNEDFFS